MSLPDVKGMYSSEIMEELVKDSHKKLISIAILLLKRSPLIGFIVTMNLYFIFKDLALLIFVRESLLKGLVYSLYIFQLYFSMHIGNSLSYLKFELKECSKWERKKATATYRKYRRNVILTFLLMQIANVVELILAYNFYSSAEPNNSIYIFYGICILCCMPIVLAIITRVHLAHIYSEL